MKNFTVLDYLGFTVPNSKMEELIFIFGGMKLYFIGTFKGLSTVITFMKRV